jgi:putative FmdB family regulatory protein
MPIYEYVCKACGAGTELMQRMSDPPATDCPACGKPELTKEISAAGFRLSGGGWYETDFKAGNKKNLVDGDKPGAAASPPAAGGDAPATVPKTEATAPAAAKAEPTATKPAPAAAS